MSDGSQFSAQEFVELRSLARQSTAYPGLVLNDLVAQVKTLREGLDAQSKLRQAMGVELRNLIHRLVEEGVISE